MQTVVICTGNEEYGDQMKIDKSVGWKMKLIYPTVLGLILKIPCPTKHVWGLYSSLHACMHVLHNARIYHRL